MALVLWAPQQKQQQRKRSARINTIIEFLDEWGYVLMRDLCSECVAAFKKRIETRVCIKIAMLLHIGIYICSQEIFEKKRERETQNGLRAKVYYRDWGDQHRQKKNDGTWSINQLHGNILAAFSTCCIIKITPKSYQKIILLSWWTFTRTHNFSQLDLINFRTYFRFFRFRKKEKEMIITNRTSIRFGILLSSQLNVHINFSMSVNLRCGEK